jgi:uncharacterized protein YcgL (UPF0745 family)
LSAHRDDTAPADPAGKPKPDTGADSVACTVFRCARQDQMYLYVREHFDLQALPAGLVKRIGALSPVMTLSLTEARVLARVSTRAVIAALRDQGWFLQLPPDGRPRVHLTFGG